MASAIIITQGYRMHFSRLNQEISYRKLHHQEQLQRQQLVSIHTFSALTNSKGVQSSTLIYLFIDVDDTQ